MPRTGDVVFEDDQARHVYVDERQTRIEHKPGSPQALLDELHARVGETIAELERADTDWGTLTAVQRTAAMRVAVRVVAKLARLALGRLDTP